ncbi:MAG: phosphohydrolase [Proteobacteria bacterium]|nr:phosphohydrolase [Pseudomonadota bacterium]MBU1650409.1 phosphohydrolase [Pseudomonadota bacterium]
MQCPGQDNRYWSGEAVFELPCPHCGNVLEFFKDDSQRTCKQCGHKTLNPKIDFGCASYCPYAEQCMGALPSDLRAGLADLFKDRLAIAVRKRLLDNEQKYLLVTRRAEFGEKLCLEEEGNMAAIVAATLLSEIDQPLALLTELKAEENLIEEVSRLLSGQPATNDDEAKSAAIFHDASLLGNMSLGNASDPANSFLTRTGAREREAIMTRLKAQTE